MKRYIALYLVGGSILLTVLTIILSSWARMPMGEAMSLIVGAAFAGLLLVSLGYALALLEVRRQKSSS